MIRYDLRCDQGHSFDGWFRSSAGFEDLRAAGHVACTRCGSVVVDKALMAPAVPAGGGGGSGGAPMGEPRAPSALERLRRHVEANSDYVGARFAAEARAMHLGDRPHRPIHGEASPGEARELIEDGVPVAPLPFIPRQKTN